MLTVQRRGEADDRPQEDRGDDCAARQPLLAQPCTNTAASAQLAGRAPERIYPAPPRRAAATGEHILHMDHELVVRERLLAWLLWRFVVERFAIRLARLRLPLPRRLAGRLSEHDRRRLGRRISIEKGGRRRSIERWRSPPGTARLASPHSRWRARRLGVLRLDRRQHRRLWTAALDPSGVSLVVYRLASGCGDVQRHHPVASQAAAGRRLLRDDEPDQLLRAAERAVETWAQPGAAHGLGGVAGRLPNVVADRLATRLASSPSGLGALDRADCRCGSVGHRGLLTSSAANRPTSFLWATVSVAAPDQRARQRSSHRAAQRRAPEIGVTSGLRAPRQRPLTRKTRRSRGG